MRRSLLAGVAVWFAIAACTGGDASPVGGDLLPGGVLGEGLEVIAHPDLALAEDYPIFPATRAEGDTLVSAHMWPDAAGFESRPLFRFSLTELDSLPPETQILEASLRLVIGSRVDEPVQLAVHRVTASWGEEAATWERRQLGEPWIQPGGDFDPVPVAEFVIETVGEPDSVAADTVEVALPTALVTSWLFESEPNDGLILIQRTPGASVQFVSRGPGGTNLNGPRLEFIVQLGDPGSPAAEISLLAREDTFIATGGGTPAGDLVVSGGAEVRRIVLMPDLTGLPDGTVVARAQLVLPVEGVSLPGDSIALVAGRVVSEFRGEKTILAAPSGSNFFGVAPVVRDSLPVDSLVFENPFLSSAVRGWLRDPETNRGLYIVLANEPSGFGAVGFAGPGALPERRPHLRLVVVPVGESGP
ncbi:MAG: DNRLRE domain-containing protein [Gemmatimonadota bacterium]